jgi:hypothetical protein
VKGKCFAPVTRSLAWSPCLLVTALQFLAIRQGREKKECKQIRKAVKLALFEGKMVIFENPIKPTKELNWIGELSSFV